MKHVKVYGHAALALLLLLTGSSVLAQLPATVTEQEAQAIAVQAYLYFYPLVTMDVTRKVLSNVERGKGMGGPMNTFVDIPAYPTAEMRQVVRPNFDTLYSFAFLDLTKEPMIISVPDTNRRYYLLPMLDMWTDVFASAGWRTTGTQAQTLVVIPPDWRPMRHKLVAKYKLPKDAQLIDAPTPYVWMLVRIGADGPTDYDAVHKIQAGLKITPLHRWDQVSEPLQFKVDPTVDMKTPPKVQVDTMPAGKYFSYAAELVKVNPPHLTDESILAQMKRIGFEPGKSWDIDGLSPAVRKALESAPADAQKLMEWRTPTIARVVNYWSMNTDTMGVYGNYYLKRAIVTQVGLGANLPEDAICLRNLGDEAGKALDGTKNYAIHFDKDAIPPAAAFWSIALYDAEGFPVANSFNRFAISSWMPLKYNPDGSLDLYFQNSSPGGDKEANWLPAPKGPFTLTMRLYAPKAEALTGKWNPPPVRNARPPSAPPQ